MTFVAGVLISLGAALMLLAAAGIIRLPDVFSRMHAGTKASSLGLALMLLGTAFIVPDGPARIKLLLAVLFQFFTAPVAAHVIGRAAYRGGIPLYKGTLYDELREDQPEGSRTQPPPNAAPGGPADGGDADGVVETDD